MSDTENTHSIPKPLEKFHDAKKRTDNELKALSKSAKGKQGKEQVTAKETEIEAMLVKLKQHWDLYNRAENGEHVDAEYATLTGQTSKPEESDNLKNPMMQQRELTKDQKKRIERENREEEQAKRIQEKIQSLPDLCKDENSKISGRLKKYHFTGSFATLETPVIGGQVCEVTGDGHCLFRAINQQLEDLSKISIHKGNLYTTWIERLPSVYRDALKTTYKISFDKNFKAFTIDTLRKMAAMWIKLHPDDFVPFLLEHDVFLSGGDIDTYCAALLNQDKVLWGGDPELAAFAALFDTPLLVVQAKGENPIYNSKTKRSDGIGTIVVTFHEFWTTAGAHYNGVVPIKAVEPF